MSITLQADFQEPGHLPRIKVIGIGGGGGNAVDYLMTRGIGGVEYFVVDTDLQDLERRLTDHKIQIGGKRTNNSGAGHNPAIGRESAEESRDQLEKMVKDAALIVLASSFGGGTGSGATPVLATICAEMEIPTLGVFTMPPSLPARRRQRDAQEAVGKVQEKIDMLVTVMTGNIGQVVNIETTPFAEALRVADSVLVNAVVGILDLIVKSGVQNIDFSDLLSVMSYRGRAFIGWGAESGENRAILAAEQALTNLFLDEGSLRHSKAVLVSIISSKQEGERLSYKEKEDIIQLIEQECSEDVDLIHGVFEDPDLEKGVRVTIIASGIPFASLREGPLEGDELESTETAVVGLAAEMPQPEESGPAGDSAIQLRRDPAERVSVERAPPAGTSSPNGLHDAHRGPRASMASEHRGPRESNWESSWESSRESNPGLSRARGSEDSIDSRRTVRFQSGPRTEARSFHANGAGASRFDTRRDTVPGIAPGVPTHSGNSSGNSGGLRRPVAETTTVLAPPFRGTVSHPGVHPGVQSGVHPGAVPPPAAGAPPSRSRPNGVPNGVPASSFPSSSHRARVLSEDALDSDRLDARDSDDTPPPPPPLVDEAAPWPAAQAAPSLRENPGRENPGRGEASRHATAGGPRGESSLLRGRRLFGPLADLFSNTATHHADEHPDWHVADFPVEDRAMSDPSRRHSAQHDSFAEAEALTKTSIQRGRQAS